MENASKALLIAAAVLIVILLIAFGMRIFNSTSGTTDSLETTMSSAEAVSFNNRFNGYIGVQSIKKAQALANVMLINNKQGEHKIGVRYKIITKVGVGGVSYSSGNETRYAAGTFTTIIGALSETPISKIKISIEEYDENGYISVIKFDNEPFE